METPPYLAYPKKSWKKRSNLKNKTTKRIEINLRKLTLKQQLTKVSSAQIKKVKIRICKAQTKSERILPSYQVRQICLLMKNIRECRLSRIKPQSVVSTSSLQLLTDQLRNLHSYHSQSLSLNLLSMLMQKCLDQQSRYYMKLASLLSSLMPNTLLGRKLLTRRSKMPKIRK